MVSAAEQQAGFSARQARVQTRIEWFGREVARNTNITMMGRVKLASQLTRDKTVANLSRPVTKSKGPRSGRIVVTERSVEGEFPRADTTRLMKDIFFDVDVTPSGPRGIIGTTLDYGLILETRMNRSFLQRTLEEVRPIIALMLTSGRPPFPEDTPA